MAIVFEQVDDLLEFCSAYLKDRQGKSSINFYLSEFKEAVQDLESTQLEVNRLLGQLRQTEGERDRLAKEFNDLTQERDRAAERMQLDHQREVDQLHFERDRQTQTFKDSKKTARDFFESCPQAIRQALHEYYPGQKIRQIKLVRDLTGSDLKSAKEFVEETLSQLTPYAD